MKIIDKYIVQCLLSPLIYCFTGFILIFIVYDLFSHLHDFVEAKTPALHIVKYYVFLIPSVLVFLFPVSILLAVLYSLTQLTRHNELTAMRASGISLYRLVIPIMLLGGFLSVVVLGINETIGPNAKYWTEQFIQDVKHGAAGSNVEIHVRKNLPLKNQGQHRDWLVGSFHSQSYEMTKIQIDQQREDGSPAYKITAKSGEWVDDSWWFSDLTIQRYDQWGNPRGAAKVEIMRQMTELDETPRDFLNEIKDPQFMSAGELWVYIKRRPHLGGDMVTRLMTEFHSRLAMPWTCLVAALIGIPFGTHTARKGALRGIVLCLLIFFAYYLFYNVGLAMGKKGIVPPISSAWASNVIFLTLASVLIYRMR